jgi:hypothetical protein
MDADWVPVEEVTFGGQEGAMTVLLGPGPTGSLVSWEVRLTFGPLDGTVRASLDFDSVVTEEALSDLLARPDLTGVVRLVGSEHGEFGAVMSLDRGRGEITATLATAVAGDGHGTITLTTDQTFLAATLQQLRRFLKQ